jgi:hypothetical protein
MVALYFSGGYNGYQLKSRYFLFIGVDGEGALMDEVVKKLSFFGRELHHF